MDNKKDDQYYLNKLIEDCLFIMKHTKNISKQDYSKDEVLQDSMMFRMIQISENAMRISDNFRGEYPEVPWFAIKGLRNRIVHDYGNVDLTIVFDTITVDIPKIYYYFQNIKNEG